MRILTLLFSLCFLIAFEHMKAQRNSALENFEIFEVYGKVQISATIKTGYSCLGMNFMRTEDTTVLFQSIGSIPGVCGSSTEPLRYDFVDENPPKNKTVYYRVQLGGIGYSEILNIRVIDTGKAAYLVSPNPASGFCNIYFKNESQNRHSLTLINRIGLTVMTVHSAENNFYLNLEGLSPGIYHFRVHEENKQRPKFSGKISVF